MNELLLQIGKGIYDRRKQLRMTQDELADKADLTPQTNSSAELGKKALRPENVIKICAALEISTDYLLLGNITTEDYSYLSDKMSGLSPEKYRYLEEIISSYISAVQKKEV